MLTHSAEIRARPRRTWFLSKAGKAEQQAQAQREEPTSARPVHATLPPKKSAAQLAAADTPRQERQLTRKQKRKREAARELAAQTGLDGAAVLHQTIRAAKASKALAKRSPRAVADQLRATAKTASPFQPPKPKRPRVDKPKLEAAGTGAAAGGDGGHAAKAAKPFRRTNHSKKSQIKRRR